MGQLEAYTLQDIYLVSIVSGVLATYFAEEIEATIESVVPYAYSANLASKRRKIQSLKLPAGDVIGALQTTFNFLQITKTSFIAIDKPLEDRVMWQDQFLNK
jgi:hypothetical protein